MAASTSAKRAPGRPRKTDEARAAEREAILASARSTIATQGPDVSLDDLAAAAGVSKPALYTHFTDKAGLAEALAASIALDVERQVLSGGVDLAAHPRRVLRSAIDAFTVFLVDETSLYRFVVRGIKGRDGDVLDNLLLPAFQTRTAALIELAFPDMSPARREVASYALLGQVFAAGEGWLRHRRTTRDELVDSLVALFSEGLPGLAR